MGKSVCCRATYSNILFIKLARKQHYANAAHGAVRGNANPKYRPKPTLLPQARHISGFTLRIPDGSPLLRAPAGLKRAEGVTRSG